MEAIEAVFSNNIISVQNYPEYDHVLNLTMGLSLPWIKLFSLLFLSIFVVTRKSEHPLGATYMCVHVDYIVAAFGQYYKPGIFPRNKVTTRCTPPGLPGHTEAGGTCEWCVKAKLFYYSRT